MQTHPENLLRSTGQWGTNWTEGTTDLATCITKTYHQVLYPMIRVDTCEPYGSIISATLIWLSRTSLLGDELEMNTLQHFALPLKLW